MLFKVFYSLTKPGIVYGNAFAGAAGFLFASGGQIDALKFLAVLIGLALVIASACVFNNIWDAKIDAQMERTKNRALVTGQISKHSALIFGLILIIFGILCLLLFTNYYSLATALFGFIVYVFIYTPFKRKTVYGTLIGAISGATPPVVGYAAVANAFDISALILFLTMLFWQMPHFYSIAIYRLKDYSAAAIPVWPVVKGVRATKHQILFYILAFFIATVFLAFYSHAGYAYLTAVTALTFAWLWLAIKGFVVIDATLWARKMFRFSLIVLFVWCVTIALNSALP